MAISRRLRFEILRRDNHTCRYCGGTPPDIKLTVDHVVPTTLGGTDEPTNLVTACQGCNSGKSSTSPDAPLVDDVAEGALLWRQLTQAAAEQLREKRRAATDYQAEFLRMWEHYLPGKKLPHNWPSTLEKFYELDVSGEDIQYAIYATGDTYGVAYAWSYFCGVMWRLVRERDALAKQMLEGAREGNVGGTNSDDQAGVLHEPDHGGLAG